MRLASSVAFVALATLSTTVVAAENHQPPDPTDPAAIVPVVPYESAFVGHKTLRESSESPAKVWRDANDEMGRIGGHAGQIKDAVDQATPEAPMSMPMPDKSTQQTPGTDGHQRKSGVDTMPPGHDMQNMKKEK
jgi:hypothetical protein